MPHDVPHRRLPLLAVVVAVLALVGVATASQVPAHSSAVGEASSVVAADDDSGSVLGGETPAVVRVAIDRVRPGHALPVVGVLPVAVAAVVATGMVVAVPWRDRLRVADVPPVRRRGPPALVLL
jgi:hypothetical protein